MKQLESWKFNEKILKFLDRHIFQTSWRLDHIFILNSPQEFTNRACILKVVYQYIPLPCFFLLSRKNVRSIATVS